MAKKMRKKSIAGMASNLNEAKRSLAPLMKQLASIAQLISETEKALGGYQEIAEGVIVRKPRATRGKAKKKPGRKPGKKAGRPAGKKKVGGLAGRLKAFRKENGLNQETLAKKLGVNVASVRAWEQGRSNPREAARKKIEKVLGGGAAKSGKAAGKGRKTRKTRKVVKATPKASETPPAAPETSQS